MRNAHESWKASIERELLRPSIHRVEAEQIGEQLLNGNRCVFAVGAGGSGKSAVLHEMVEEAESRGWTVLALRLDRQEPFSSTVELGLRFGLETSPTSSLARVAGDQPSLLVIDQLDAVSKASGRIPQTFEAVADLVREATAFPNMRVLLACRKFDLDNDDRIRTLTKEHQAKQVPVAELSDAQVLGAVQALEDV
ncbi:ATP-binding protein [Micromonospora sp. KC207]|uniref:nSTAND1 domain-containing NTPase n=1 Tax=Micromonospora sp. KC207 TaxID=2530377 RepID=UPI00104E8768|nr:ATP-binding protein [Micromonospora sp. KC207]TDC59076.1 ATP-binding protein [Micromonospora sp. KC207]